MSTKKPTGPHSRARKKPNGARIDLTCCSVKFSLGTRPIGVCLEPDDYILSFEGEIALLDPEEGENESAVGWIKGFVVQVGCMSNAGQDVYEACEAHSQALADYHAALFDETGQHVLDDVCEGFGNDLLIIDRIEVLPKFRGARLGLLAMLTAIDTFGAGCGAVAIKPFPLQAECNGNGRQGRSAELELDKLSPHFAPSLKKLRAYWSRAGFTRYKDTDYFVMDLAKQGPTKEDVLG